MTQQLKGILFALAACAVIAGSSFLTACNTVQGAGKDVEAAGGAMQSSACKHNDTSTKDCNK